MSNQRIQRICVCACVRACVRACALLVPEGLFEGILRRFCSGGRWVLGVFHSDVISPDNGLVKAGILRALSAFDCVGQLWRNGHYLPVSGSIKKPPAPVTPVLRVPTGGGTCVGHTLALKKMKAVWMLVYSLAIWLCLMRLKQNEDADNIYTTWQKKIISDAGV